MNRRIILKYMVSGSMLLILATSYTYSDKQHIKSMPPYGSRDTLNIPVLFAEGTITTKDDEFGGTFTPDGTTCYFSKSVLRFYLDIICYSQFKNGKWQTPG